MNKGRTIGRKLAKWVLVIGILLAIFNTIICNEKPIYYSNNGDWSAPAIREMGADLGLISSTHGIITIDETASSIAVYPPIRYSYDYIPKGQDYLRPPLSQGSNGIHLLGTDRLGRDVFAGILRGFYISFKVSFFSIMFAGIIGLFIGICMGYYGDFGIRWNKLQIGSFLIFSLLIIFYTIYPFSGIKQIAFIFGLLIASGVLHKVLGKLNHDTHSIYFDTFFLKIIEILKSIPTLIVLLAILPIIQVKGTTAIVLLLSILLWRNFARYSRAETLSAKEEDFITASKAQGQSDILIMIKHIFPNILSTILTLASFTFASIILLESYLSFLGIGMEVTEVSWGSLLSEGRLNKSAWWLSIFPGLCIFIVILAINIFVDKKINLDDRS